MFFRDPAIVYFNHIKREKAFVEAQIKANPNLISLFKKRLDALKQRLENAQGEIRQNIQIKEQGKNTKRAAGSKPEAEQIMPRDNHRCEIASQIGAVMPHIQEDRFLENQMMACNLLMTKPPSPHGRLVGLELEITGMDSAQLSSIIQTHSPREWKVVGDGSIPYWENKCGCDREPRCTWCNQKQNKCFCCLGSIVRCPGCNHAMYLGDCASSNHFQCRGCSRGIPVNLVLPCNYCLTGGAGCGFSGHSRRNRCSHVEGWHGAEVVSPPGKTEAFFEKAEEILKAIKEQSDQNGSDYRLKVGDRATGFHVHVDARELTKEQCALVVAFFMHNLNEYKQKFKSILPTWRTNNFYYCKTNRFSQKEKLIDLFHNTTGDRYKMVNLDSLRKHNTIEFRVGYMPETSEEMVLWTKTLRELVESVYVIDPEALKNATVEEGLEILTGKHNQSWLEDDKLPFMKALFKFLDKSTVAI